MADLLFRTLEGNSRALLQFHRAIDPNYATAYGLALVPCASARMILSCSMHSR
jgi:hypothetical protein